MEIDRYTKLLLTVIAIALVIIALNPWLTPRVAEADRMMDENIKKFAARTWNLTDGDIPVFTMENKDK